MVRRVALIIGPPGSGKTTHAKTTGLRHLEREQYATDHAFRRAALTAATHPDAHLAVVRCCPTHTEQHEWFTLLDATELVIMPTPLDECIRRIHTRGRAGWRGEIAAAKEWHRVRAASVGPDPRPAPATRW